MVGFIYGITTHGQLAVINVEEICTAVYMRQGNSLRFKVVVNTRDGKQLDLDMTMEDFKERLAEVTA